MVFSMKAYGGSNIVNMYVMGAFEEFARSEGIEYYRDEVSGMFLVLKTTSGNDFVVTSSPFNINRAGAVRLCGNKAACSCYLKAAGFNVPDEICFTRLRRGAEGAKAFFNAVEKFKSESGHGYPLIVKPNGLSQGSGVCKLRSDADCFAYFAQTEELKSRYFLIQEYIKANDYRIVVLGDRVIQAYKRIPFYIEGNGKDSVAVLVENKRERFVGYGRDREVNPVDDPRTVVNLAERGYSMETIPANGEKIVLQDVSNLSLGGESVDCTDVVSSFFRELAVKIAHSLGLSLCGIDIFATDITKSGKGDDFYRIIEVNSAPGLDNYAFIKEIQEKYVRNLYRQVFDYIICNL